MIQTKNRGKYRILPGANAGQADILGMAQILAAYDWGIMTDMFGNIPCSEAFKASAPKSIHKRVFMKTSITCLMPPL